MARPVTHKSSAEAEDRGALLRIIKRAETNTTRAAAANQRIIVRAKEILSIYLEPAAKRRSRVAGEAAST